jgi:hypothetical protein
MIRFWRIAVLLACLPVFWGQGPPAANGERGAKIWVGRYQEIEEYLRTAECVSILWGPDRSKARCTLTPGGPIARMAWKSPPDGVYRGFRESYKTEIAAYELDKLLKMDMVPPSVERQLQGIKGTGQQWVENALPVKADEPPDQPHRADWETQLVRKAMFDNLIGNRDRNWGNMLRDAAWNVILIDHSRAFGASTELTNKLSRIDEAFWARIESLTRSQLDGVLREWLDENQIGAILDRREKMRAEIRLLPR